MTETEIERLVVRLVGDSTSYVKMLTDAQNKTAAAAKSVEQTAGRIEKFQKSMEGFAAGASRTLGAVGITLGLKELYDQFDKADDLITELSAVIKANGREVDVVLPKYREFAKEMADLTQITSKGAILELAKQAEMLGLTGERAQKAVKTAITLGAMKDADPNSFMRQAVNFEKTGNAAGLARILGLMGEMEEDTTKAAETAKLLEKNWDLVIVKGEDGGTKIQRSLNQIKEVGKEAGKVVSDVFEPLIEHLAAAAKWFQQLDPTVRSVIAHLIVLAAVIEPVAIGYSLLTARVLAAKEAIVALSAAILANPLAVAVVLALGAAYLISSRESAKFNEELKKGVELGKKTTDSMKAQISMQSTEVNARNMSGLAEQLNRAKEKLAELNTAKKDVPVFGAGFKAQYEEQKAIVDDLQRRYDAYKEARDETMKPTTTGPAKALLDDLRSLNDELHKGIQTVGMSAEEVKIWELRARAAGDAAVNADLDVAEYNARMLEAAKAQRAAADSARDLERSLQLQVKTLGMSEREAAKVKLEMEGVDADQMKRIDNLYKEIEVWEAMEEALKWGGDAAEKTKEQFQSLNAVVAGGADAAQLIYQYANQFGADAGAVNKAATLRRADFSAQPDRNFLGPQVKSADGMRETEKKLDDLKTVLEQIRDKDTVSLGPADLSA